MEIIRAGLGDLKELAQFGKDFFAENNMPGSFSVERFIEVWTLMLGQAGGVIISAQENGSIVGAISGFRAFDLYTTRVLAQECFWYVSEPYRNTRLGLKLFIEFEKWAEEIKADQIRVGCAQGPHHDSLFKFFTRRNYERSETHFTKEL
jgi:hypothetical protein